MAEVTPWGSWQILHEEKNRVIKLLNVNPGGMLSLQRHHHRSEMWIPLDDGLVATIDGDSLSMKSYNQYFVPAYVVHRLTNPTGKYASIIEVIFGKYDEEDIVRLQDIYGR